MQSVGVREFKTQASQILRQVRDKGEIIEITYHGRVIAHLVPADEPESKEVTIADIWRDMDELTKEISKHWPAGISALDAILEDRH